MQSIFETSRHAPDDENSRNEILVERVSWQNYVLLRLTETTDLSKEFLTTVYAKYVDQTATHLFVHEGGKDDENPHIHATFRIVGTVQAFRQFLGRNGFKGNESYSLKVADPEKMHAQFRYLCKGTGTGEKDRPKIGFHSKNLTDSVINEFHDAYWKESQTLSNGKTKRKREEPASKQILAICRQKIEHGSKIAISEDEIIDITLAWYFEKKTSMNTFQMKAVVNYVSYGLNSDSNRVHLMKQSLKF